MTTVDARGLSCPEPVILTRKALASGAASYEIIVDNHASKENVTRFAEKYLATEGKHSYFELNTAMTKGMVENARKHIRVFRGID